MKNQKEEGRRGLNKKEININKGFELMLRKNSTMEGKKKKQNTFEISFEKMFSFFKRNLHFGFTFFGNIKKNSQEN